MSNIQLPAEILDELTPGDMTEIMDLADAVRTEHSTDDEAARALLIHAKERVFINRATKNVPTPRNVVDVGEWGAEFDGNVYRNVTILSTPERRDLWATYAGIQYAPSGEITDCAFVAEYAEVTDPAELEQFAADLIDLARRAREWSPEW
ncbi:hypothetical protein [Hoyosella altamirensis]|uniref:Uncharacterized protein n=1 Tax=Hoyosella altamirensis TaxID=616997 RepID=A0A839RRL0_9ACTN|nr:hypothetical protein [Hoyosella altamirensis]MBB3038987.1 hypothetical protein [Hoyosella altamirensis]